MITFTDLERELIDIGISKLDAPAFVEALTLIERDGTEEIKKHMDFLEFFYDSDDDDPKIRSTADHWKYRVGCALLEFRTAEKKGFGRDVLKYLKADAELVYKKR